MAEETVQLSEREREILKLVATGATNQQIAGDLGISINTVKVHLRNIFGKIGAASRTEATMYAVRAGLIEVGKAAVAPEPAATPVVSATQGATTPSVPDPQAGARPPTGLSRNLLLGIGSAGGLLIALLVIWLIGQRPGPPAETPTAIPTALGVSGAAPSGVTASWVAQRDMPIALGGAGAASVDGSVYVIGGKAGSGVAASTWRFDPASGSWASLPDKPTPVHSVQAAVLGGKIFVPGGERADGTISAQLEVYDPIGQSWEQRASLPSARSGYGLVAFEGRLYLFGGWDGSGARAETYEYDPTTDRWSMLAAMPTARAYPAAVAVDGKIYVLGGEAAGAALSANEQFTPALGGPGTWAKVTPLDQPRSRFGASGLSNNIVLLGGEAAQAPALYDVRTATWQSLKPPALPLGAQPAVATRDSSIFVVTGDPTRAASALYELRILYTVTITLP